MKYYMAINGQQAGPFDESELPSQGLTPTTLVWTEGMTEWKPANEVPALAYLLGTQQAQTPPNLGGYQQSAWNQPQVRPAEPKTWLVESILVTLFCCLVFGIVGIIKASSVSSLYNQGRYAEAEQASREAGKWVKWGFWLSIVFLLIYILIIAMVGVSNIPLTNY